MKILISGILVVLSIIIWLWPHYQIRRIYGKVIAELGPHPYSVVSISEDMSVLLSDAYEHWAILSCKTGGEYSDGLSLFGLTPSVTNLIKLINHRPKYYFLNKQDIIAGKVQALLLPRAIDQSIHLSDDGHLAFIRLRTNAIAVFTDTDGRLNEALYIATETGK